MRQKVLIASALIHRPEVLFLDEPLDGLDANAAMVVKEVLKQLAGQGRTILFCSHILDVVERMCTRIVIINNGRQIADGTADAIRAHDRSRHAGRGVQPRSPASATWRAWLPSSSRRSSGYETALCRRPASISINGRR